MGLFCCGSNEEAEEIEELRRQLEAREEKLNEQEKSRVSILLYVPVVRHDRSGILHELHAFQKYCKFSGKYFW